MHSGFLRHRFGVLLCMVGAVILSAAISYNELDALHAVRLSSEFSRTLVIDPGHGGDDGGAVSTDGIQEADINLSIGNRLFTLAELCGIPVVRTRDSSKLSYPKDAQTIAARKVADQKQRVAFINETPNAILISIHQNQFPTAQPHGAQVLYGTVVDSAGFGQMLQEQLIMLLDRENRRVAAPISDDIYLTKHVNCPAVLVECGFLSNPEECARLQTDEYQLQLTLTILSSYLQYYQNGSQI